MGGIASGGAGGSKNKSKSQSGVKYNTDFMDQFEERYGSGAVTRGDVLKYAPEPQTTFDYQNRKSLENLGFGQKSTNFDAPTYDAPASRLAGGDYDRLEGSLFRSRFDPASREIERQRSLQNDALSSRLAASGLFSSGTGVAQQVRQDQDFNREAMAQASDAANAAATQRYDLQSREGLANAQLQADTQRLNQGALDSTRQLNVQQVDADRGRMLQLIGLEQADLQRLDQGQLDRLDRMMAAYRDAMGLAVDAGQFSKSKSKGTQGNAYLGTGK